MVYSKHMDNSLNLGWYNEQTKGMFPCQPSGLHASRHLLVICNFSKHQKARQISLLSNMI